MGSVNSFSRSLFSQLVPPGEEASYFGLYSISDKGSAFLGPFVISMIVQATGTMRWGFFYILFMIGLPLILFPFLLPARNVRAKVEIDMRRRRREIVAGSVV